MSLLRSLVFRRLADHLMDAGTALAVCVFLYETHVRTSGLASHSTFVAAVMGFGVTSSSLLLRFLTAAQLLCSMAILLKPVYERVGAVRASTALAATQAFELVLYRALDDRGQMLKLAACCASLCMVALFRHDSKVRGMALGVPISDRVVNAQAFIRARATRASCLLASVPICCVCCLYATACLFHVSRGVQVEVNRARWCVCMATASSALLLGAQDARSKRAVTQADVERAAAMARRVATGVATRLRSKATKQSKRL